MAKQASKMWHSQEPTSAFIEFEAGHIVNMDTPDHFNKTLKGYLDKYNL